MKASVCPFTCLSLLLSVCQSFCLFLLVLQKKLFNFWELHFKSSLFSVFVLDLVLESFVNLSNSIFIYIFTLREGERESKRWSMDKLKQTGWNLGQVFHSRLGCTCIGHAIVYITKQPNLKLKTRPKQLLGSLPLVFALL